MRSLAANERRKNVFKVGLLVLLIVGGILLGLWDRIEETFLRKPAAGGELKVEEMIDGTAQIDAMTSIDDASVYSADDPESIVYFYVTVRFGSEARGTNHTFTEVNSAIRFVDGAHADNNVLAEALVQVGDENGPVEGMLGFGETDSNATIRIRGNTSSAAAVKSYKLSLDDETGTWRGQSNIALNKHIWDVTRFRNKLYFDVLKDIPEVPSLRTQFVVLYIKDETAGETEFTNYGLFTQVEVPTKKYLKNHGMDSSGYLYKVISFNWETNELIKNIDDPAYDAAAMDTVISNRGREDNQRLIELVNAVNDFSIDINYIIDTYFDRENYVTWLAYNILMGNIDTTMQNYYLYSPLNGNKWYFIPWDGDASLYWKQKEIQNGLNQYAEWQCGISNYWSILLHQRFLKYESNRQELKEKVDQLYEMLNDRYLEEKILSYNETVSPYVKQLPDLLHVRVTMEERDYIVATLADEVNYNYERFNNSLTALMPFWIYSMQQDGDTVTFSWSDAYDFAAYSITYDFKLSKYPDMREPVLVLEDLDVLSYTVEKEMLESGTYYMEVVAHSADGRSVDASNKIEVDGTDYPGIYDCYIK